MHTFYGRKNNMIWRNFFRDHCIGILIAIIIGAIVAAPPIIWHFSPEFRGVEMLKTNTEVHYVAQVQEVYDGDPLLRNPFFADLKDAPYLFPPLSPNIVAWFGKLFSLSAIHAVIVTRFLFVTLLSFCIYFLTTLMSGSRRAGFIAAPFVILGYALVDPKNIFALFGIGAGGGENTFIDYGRPINPAMSSLFFFAYMVCFWQYLYAEKQRRLYGILSVVLLGVSFYVYLFTWTFIYTFNAFLFLLYGWQKDKERMKKVFLVSGVAALFGIPYFLNVYRASFHPDYAVSSLRFGFVKTHEWHLSRVLVGAAVVFAFVYRRLPRPLTLWYAAIFLAAFVVANEQVVTGQYLFNDHYHWYYTTPLLIIFGSIILGRIGDQCEVPRRWWARGATMFVIALLFYQGIRVQYTSYQHVLPEVRSEQRYASVFSWLNTETPKESVVYASYPIMKAVPALTHNNVYFHGTGIYTLVPNERLLHTYLVSVYLHGVPTADSRAYFEAHQAEIVSVVYGYTYSFQRGVCATCVPSEVIDELTKTYATLTDKNFLDFVKKYPINYLVWDKTVDPTWNLSRFGLAPTMVWNDVTVYSL